jgi:hypothetical protein
VPDEAELRKLLIFLSGVDVSDTMRSWLALPRRATTP